MVHIMKIVSSRLRYELLKPTIYWFTSTDIIFILFFPSLLGSLLPVKKGMKLILVWMKKNIGLIKRASMLIKNMRINLGVTLYCKWPNDPIFSKVALAIKCLNNWNMHRHLADALLSWQWVGDATIHKCLENICIVLQKCSKL